MDGYGELSGNHGLCRGFCQRRTAQGVQIRPARAEHLELNPAGREGPACETRVGKPSGEVAHRHGLKATLETRVVQPVRDAEGEFGHIPGAPVPTSAPRHLRAVAGRDTESAHRECGQFDARGVLEVEVAVGDPFGPCDL
jgi:hypothetical protein